MWRFQIAKLKRWAIDFSVSMTMQVTLTVTEGPHQGCEFTFGGHDTFIVGRGERAHFRLSDKDKFFSRTHFVIEVNPPHCRIMDLGSRNGTIVNDEKIEATDFKDGDVIRGGKTVIRVGVLNGPFAQPPELAVEGSGSGRRLSDLPTVPPCASPQFASTGSYRPDGFELPDCDVVPLARQGGAKDSLATCDSCGGSFSVEKQNEQVRERHGARGAESRICPTCHGRIRELPQPIPGYRIVRELGRGGMGVVYLAVRALTGELAAVKTILPNVAASWRDVEKFLREARILCELDHPHIVAFREMGEADGQLYFAMDYVPGIDAARLLVKEGYPLSVPRAVRLVGQMLQALDYAHAKGFVHRDIKPSNLLVSTAPLQRDAWSGEVARLADFGLARAYESSRLSGLTMTGKFGGTLHYMAPEQLTNFRDAKPSVDIYSAAATLYSLLTGRHVYDFPEQTQRKIVMLLQDDPILIESRRQDIPGGLAAVIGRALARDPSKRYETAAAMRRALAPFAR
jgi:serine/threonine-protein kinase